MANQTQMAITKQDIIHPRYFFPGITSVDNRHLMSQLHKTVLQMLGKAGKLTDNQYLHY